MNVFLLALGWLVPITKADTTNPTPLAWEWNQTPRSYFISTDLNLVAPVMLASHVNQEILVSRVQLDLLTKCVMGNETRRTWTLSCAIDDVALRAAPVLSRQAQGLAQVIDEVVAHLRGATVEVILTRRGTVRTVDLQGLTRRTSRHRSIEENCEALIKHSMAGFDLELPPGEAIAGGAPWKQRNAVAVTMPTMPGSMASSRLQHTATDEGAVVRIDSTGKGAITVNETVGAYSAVFRGEAIMSANGGHLLERNWFVEATPSPTAMDLFGRRNYTHSLQLVLLVPDQDPPGVGETGLM